MDQGGWLECRREKTASRPLRYEVYNGAAFRRSVYLTREQFAVGFLLNVHLQNEEIAAYIARSYTCFSLLYRSTWACDRLHLPSNASPIRSHARSI